MLCLPSHAGQSISLNCATFHPKEVLKTPQTPHICVSQVMKSFTHQQFTPHGQNPFTGPKPVQRYFPLISGAARAACRAFPRTEGRKTASNDWRSRPTPSPPSPSAFPAEPRRLPRPRSPAPRAKQDGGEDHRPPRSLRPPPGARRPLSRPAAGDAGACGRGGGRRRHEGRRRAAGGRARPPGAGAGAGEAEEVSGRREMAGEGGMRPRTAAAAGSRAGLR